MNALALAALLLADVAALIALVVVIVDYWDRRRVARERQELTERIRGALLAVETALVTGEPDPPARL
jgi:hypothetical protein